MLIPSKTTGISHFNYLCGCNSSKDMFRKVKTIESTVNHHCNRSNNLKLDMKFFIMFLPAQIKSWIELEYFLFLSEWHYKLNSRVLSSCNSFKILELLFYLNLIPVMVQELFSFLSLYICQQLC